MRDSMLARKVGAVRDGGPVFAAMLVASMLAVHADAPNYSGAIERFHQERRAARVAPVDQNRSLETLNTLALHGLRPLRPALIAGNDTHFAQLTRPLRDAATVLPASTAEPERWGPVQRVHLLVSGCPCIPASTPGHVPDGRFVAGTPLTIAKNASDPTQLDLFWGASCSAATDYSVHEGTIGSWYSHNALACSTSSALTTTVTPSAGHMYYVVVPLSAIAEGSYGTDVFGNERPPSPSGCRAQQVLNSCP